VNCTDLESASDYGDCCYKDTRLQVDVHLEDRPMALTKTYSLRIARRFRREVGSGALVVPAIVFDICDRVHVLRALVRLFGLDSTRLKLADVVVAEDMLESARPATSKFSIIT